MYRLLEVGEVIENGDQYWCDNRWRQYEVAIGLKLTAGGTPSRRLVKPDVTPAALPDPGEGYRLIDKAVDKPEPGDEFWNDVRKVWETRCFGVRDTSRFTSRDIYRRKLPAVTAPVVSVGDRVKVLTGPWAGCTGVIIAFEVEVSVNPCGKMTALKDSVPVVRLDNVWVGGQRPSLTLPADQVEKLPPVVPEVLYRDLSHGETIRDEDEYLFCGNWLAGSTDTRSVGKKLEHYHVRHRRPVRLQSPGWRYLDAGETVQAGDEAFCENVGPGFWPLPILNGSLVNNEKLFRRKLPANQGG